MNVLISSITKFVQLILDLYSPLPYQLFADLHTLNVYLRSYSDNEQKLLQGYLHKLEEKLLQKKSKMQFKDNDAINIGDYEGHFMKHYHSCQVRPEVSDIQSNKENIRNNQAYHDTSSKHQPLSSRSKQEQPQGRMKSDSHKLGNKQRNKTTKNAPQQTNFVLKIQRKNGDDNDSDKNLKNIKSEMDLHPQSQPMVLHRKKSTDIFLKKADEITIKNRSHYESNESKNNAFSSSSSLRIKLKPRSTYDLIKMREVILELSNELQSNEGELEKLRNQLGIDVQANCGC